LRKFAVNTQGNLNLIKVKLARLKKIAVTIIGFTILLFGIILTVFPGPAFIVIPIGLAILATEYVWAKKLYDKMKNRIQKMIKK
jgi:tellurite resistance protein TerC